MGSVPHLYTTGDNDPEIEPRQYYRHYLYCDACGSFDLEPWTTGDTAAIAKKRARLAKAARIATLLLVVVPAWVFFGLLASLVFLLILGAGVVVALLVRGLVGGEAAATGWRFVKAALVMLLPVALAEWVARDLLPPIPMLLGGLVIVAGLLVAREVLAAKIEHLGMRCRQCGATYANGTSFFTNLDANPRKLTVSEVPRPLGVSHFLVGKSVP